MVRIVFNILIWQHYFIPLMLSVFLFIITIGITIHLVKKELNNAKTHK
ncbi:MAG TPA: hypothetical protein PLB45_02825 [Bacilli bacterium]|nr:hypothetical protein [Bacilli bacterium]HQC83787.1 hypothetical protein [Bacilli bacterium]